MWSGTFASGAAFGDVEASLFVAGAVFALKFGQIAEARKVRRTGGREMTSSCRNRARIMVGPCASVSHIVV